MPSSSNDVYARFLEELDAMTIRADESAVAVVGRLTRAVKRAQMTNDGVLAPVSRRSDEQKANY